MAAFYICLGIWAGGPDCGVCGTRQPTLSCQRKLFSILHVADMYFDLLISYTVHVTIM